MGMSSDQEKITQPSVGLPNLIRWGQTQRELKRLETEIQAWFTLRYDRDKDEFGRYQGLHKTRLDTLKDVLENGLIALRAELDRLDTSPQRSSQAVYKECRQFDQTIVWMERVWLYYKEKFDQRDQVSGLGSLLKAADEVVWSCYKQVFIRKDLLPPEIQIGPAPLSFVAPEYSPATWEADRLSPAEVRTGRIEGLEEFMQTLPVPVLSLPPWCLAAPWWLVFVAHEVGHNIQRELKLTEPFEATLERVCQEQGRPPQPDTRLWKGWSKEIFADLFSVMMLGGWAVRGLLELELAPPEDLLKRRGEYYPAPAVRLHLLARAADRSGFDGSSALDGLDLMGLAKGAGAVEKDMELVEPVLDAILNKPLSEKTGSLEKLCGLTEQARAGFVKEVSAWSTELAKAKPANPAPSLLSPRYIVAGSMAAWVEASRQTSTELQAIQPPSTGGPAQSALGASVDQKLQLLSQNTIEKLVASGPTGVRARQPAAPEAASFGAELARRLLDASRQPGTGG